MKFGVREICDVVLRAKSTQKIGNKIFYKNEPVCYFDTLKTSTLEGAATTVYAQGGRGNARLMSWDGERTVTFTMEDALISPIGLSILTGAGLIDATTTKPIITHVTETLQITDTNYLYNGLPKFTLQYEPYTQENEQSIYVMGLDDNGEVITEPYIFKYLRGSNNEIGFENQNSYRAQENIDLNYNHVKLLDCSAVLVDYYRKQESNAFEVQISPNKFGGTFYLEASTLWRDQGSGSDLPAEFIIPNCRIQSNFSFSMSSSGDPSTFTFTIDAFPDYTRWNKTEKVLADIQVIGANTSMRQEVPRTQTWADPNSLTSTIAIGVAGLTPSTFYFSTKYARVSDGAAQDPSYLPKLTGTIYIASPQEATENTIYRIDLYKTNLKGETNVSNLFTGTRAESNVAYDFNNKIFAYEIEDGLDMTKRYTVSILLSEEGQISETRTLDLITYPSYYEFKTSEINNNIIKGSFCRQLIAATGTAVADKEYYSKDADNKYTLVAATDIEVGTTSVSSYYTWDSVAHIAVTILPELLNSDHKNDNGILGRVTKVEIYRNTTAHPSGVLINTFEQADIFNSLKSRNGKATLSYTDATPWVDGVSSNPYYTFKIYNNRMTLLVEPTTVSNAMLKRELAPNLKDWNYTVADKITIDGLIKADKELIASEEALTNDNSESESEG